MDVKKVHPETVAEAEAVLAKAARLENSIHNGAEQTKEAIEGMKRNTDGVIQDVDRTFDTTTKPDLYTTTQKPIVARANSPECDTCLAQFRTNGGCKFMTNPADHGKLMQAIPRGCSACSAQAPAFCGIILPQ